MRKGFSKKQNLKLKDEEKTYSFGELAVRLTAFSSQFAKYFKTSTKSIHSVSNQFLQGLFLSPASNCQSIGERVIKSNNQSLNHFLTDSVWDWNPIMDFIANRFYKLIAKDKSQLALLIDESGMPKKGKHSVGVAHQYCGQTGKQDNCQVGVFGAFSYRNISSIIQSRLYLPKEWVNDKNRCIKAGVPISQIQYKSKIDLALEIIFHVRKDLKLKFGYVSFDAFYGRDLSLLQTLDKENIVFMADIPENLTIYLKDFSIEIPQKKTGRGRNPIHSKPTIKGIKVKEYAKTIKKNDWKRITVRTGSEQKIKASFYKKTIWVFNAEQNSKSRYTLLIRKDDDGSLRYSLTNSKAHLQKIATMQGQRYFIERAFQDAKQQVGMNQYQVRSYQGWHRHMTMCMMAMQFIAEEKARQFYIDEYVTAADVVELLCLLLPKNDLTLKELEKKIKNKNKRPKKLYKSSKIS